MVYIKPEQSKPAFVVPPYLYFTPRFSAAASINSSAKRFVFLLSDFVNFSFFVSDFLEVTIGEVDLQAVKKTRINNRNAKCFKRIFFLMNLNSHKLVVNYCKSETMNLAVFSLAPMPPNLFSNNAYFSKSVLR